MANKFMPDNNNSKPKSLLQRIVQAVNNFFLLIAKMFGFVSKGPVSARHKVTRVGIEPAVAEPAVAEPPALLSQQELLNLQPLIDAIKGLPDSAGSGIKSNLFDELSRTAKETTHAHLSFNGTDAAAR